MNTKKPGKGKQEKIKKPSSLRARSGAGLKKIRAEIVESERRTQNRIEFIVEQQAQFATDMGELKNSLGELENVMTRLASATLAHFEESRSKHDEADEKFAALVDAQLRSEEAAKKSDEKIAALVDAQLRSEEAAKKSDEKIAALQTRAEEAAKKTDEKLAALMEAQLKTELTVKKTSEDVRRLSAVVDRYLKERRNGN